MRSPARSDVGGAGSPDSGVRYDLTSLPTSSGYGLYTLSGGLVNTVQNQGFAENIGSAGTGIFTQTGGVNITRGIALGGQATTWDMVWKTQLGHLRLIATPTTFLTPGTYNLNGGVLQANSIGIIEYSHPVNGYLVPPAYFNFTAGTLQAGVSTVYSGQTLPGGLNIGTPLTLGPAASNVATLDANGQTVTINYADLATAGYLTGPGQLRVIDSAGGGVVVIAGNGVNNYTGGTIVSSGTLQAANSFALPATGVLTVGGPEAVVLSAQMGTLFGSTSVGATIDVGSAGLDVAGLSPATDATISLVPAVAIGADMAPSTSGPTPVPEPSTLALLGTGVLSLLGLAWRRKLVGQAPRA